MEYNGKECKVECNCIEIAEYKNGGHEVKNYMCFKGAQELKELMELK